MKRNKYRSTRSSGGKPRGGSEAAILAVLAECSKMSVGTQTSVPASPPNSPSSSDILAAITSCKEALTSKIDSLSADVSFLRHDMEKFRTRMGEAEARISQVEETTRSDSEELQRLQRQVRGLQEKAVDTENRLRRNNVRVLGLPERVEGKKPAEFAETFLATLLDLQDLPPTFVVERAHRVPPVPPKPGAPARPFLIRLLNYRDRDRVLAAARSHPNLQYENARVSLFPDYSTEIQQRRRSYTEVRKRLREKGLQYGLLYPSRLRVTDGDTTRFFDTPAAAVAWLDGT